MSRRISASRLAGYFIPLRSSEVTVSTGNANFRNEETRRRPPTLLPHTPIRVPGSRPGSLSKSSQRSSPEAERSAYFFVCEPLSKSSAM